MSAWRRLSTGAKALLATVLVLAATAAIQIALLSSGVRPVIAVVAPLVAPPLVAYLYTRVFVRHRLLALKAAFSRLAQGELDAALPPAPDSDLVPLRETFEAMSGALRELTARLRNADAQRRRLFADLAHELATPMSTILGISDALRSERLSSTPEERAWLLRSLEDESNRLVRLIGDIRDLANLDDPDTALEAEATDVGDIARRTAERLNLVGKGGAPCAAIRCRIEAAPVLADPTRIEQAVTNLLTNAQRHTPAGGIIELEVVAASGARIVVADSGEGVPDAVLARLGERLFRADESRTRRTGGHGLGLSIVSAIVARHAGRLSFSRAELGGLRVEIELPALAARGASQQNRNIP